MNSSNNSNNNISFIKFPKENIKFNIKLDNYQKFFTSYFPKELFYFKGNIDLNKFIKSLNDALDYHYLMLGNLKKHENGDIYITYDPYNKDHIEKDYLEVEKLDSPIKILKSTLNNKDYFTNKFDDLLDDNCFAIDMNNEISYSYSKLIIFNDGFIFSLCACHSFIDQYTVCNFIKAISELYSNNINNSSSSSLIEPYYFNTSMYLYKNISNKDNLEDDIFDKFGSIHQSKLIDFMEQNGNDKFFFNNSIIKLKFNLEQFKLYHDQCFKLNNIRISKNDIMNAILLKSLTFTNYLNDNDYFTLRYINDIRNQFNMGRNYYGCAINISKFKLNVGYIRNASIIELAIESNKSNKSHQKNDFVESLILIKRIIEQDNDFSTYPIAPSFYSTSITNWTSFDFNTIKFGNEIALIANQSQCLSTLGLLTVTFETNESNIKYYTISISIPTNCIDKVNDFSNKTKLFTFENILINNAKL